jgi:simple sugar transport system permease protein
MKTIAATYSGIPILQDLNVSKYVYKMIPYIATLLVLALTSKNSQAPKAEGIPYDQGKR